MSGIGAAGSEGSGSIDAVRVDDAPAPLEASPVEAEAPEPPHVSAEGAVRSAKFGADLLEGMLHSQLDGEVASYAPIADRQAAPEAPALTPQQAAAQVRAARARGDHQKVAEVIGRASAESLPAIEQATGEKIEYLLDDCRTKAPEAYRKALDGLTSQVADRGAGLKAKEALARTLNLATASGSHEGYDYVDRHLRPPGCDGLSPEQREKAVLALSRAGNLLDDTVSALVRHGDPKSSTFASDLRRFPPALVDAHAKPLVREMAARAHLHPDDKKAAQLADKAALALFSAGTEEGQQVGIDHYVGKAADDAIEAGRACLQIDSAIHAAKSRLAELQAMKKLNADQGTKGPLTAQGKADLDADIKMYEEKVTRLEGQKDELGKQTLERMNDPQFQAMLKRLPAEEQQIMLRPMLANIQGTKHAKALFEQHVKPAIEGKESVLADIFEGTDKTREFAMSIVEGLAPQFADAGDSTFSAALQKILGKTPGEMAKLEEAVAKLNQAEPGSDAAAAAAREVEELAGAGVAAKTLKSVFAGFALMISLKKLAEKPELKEKLGAAKDMAALTQAVGELMAATPELAQYARFLGHGAKAAGAVAGVLAFGVGVMDMNEAIDHLDPGSAVGSYMEAAGGLIAAGGVVIPPLAIVGAVVGVGGWVVKKTWGDSDEVRAMKGWAQRNGYAYR